jgi:Protein of unknown function (DUF3631)
VSSSPYFFDGRSVRPEDVVDGKAWDERHLCWEEVTWIEPASVGAALLNDLASFLSRFVAFPSREARDAVALWVPHAHALDAFESTPRLAALSPEKGSGKTRLLEVLDLLLPNPMHAVNISAPALFRQIGGSKRPELLADEADTYLGLRVAKDHEELRGLVNAGHRRGAVAYRCVGEPSKMQVVEFPAFCAVALAGIGDLPDTIIDRSIVIKMRRRAPHERIEQFRLRKVRPEGERLRDRCAAWAQANLEALTEAEPLMPRGITDRAADVWEALFAIADSAQGEWPARARAAAIRLNEERRASDPSLGVQLLADIKVIFEKKDTDRVSTEELVDLLCGMEEAPWGELRGKPIDPRGVARRLKPFGVGPKQIRFDDVTKKGYEIGDFLDPWGRYLAPPEESETSETAGTPQVAGPESVTYEPPVSLASETDRKRETPLGPPARDVASVSAVSLSGESEADSNGRVAEAEGVWVT